MKLFFYDLNVKTMILIWLGMEKIKQIRLRPEIITSKELRLTQELSGIIKYQELSNRS